MLCVSALAGALGASLSSMVANLTLGKKKWIPVHNQMSKVAVKSQKLKDELIQLIDADTDSFKVVMEAYGMPKTTENQSSNEKRKKQQKLWKNVTFSRASISKKL